jgi:hypothetical protein
MSGGICGLHGLRRITRIWEEIRQKAEVKRQKAKGILNFDWVEELKGCFTHFIIPPRLGRHLGVWERFGKFEVWRQGRKR